MTTKTDVMVKLVLVFFISLLSFSIGTFVGKKYSDNQHKLAALEPVHETKREVASAPVDHHGDATMTDDEIAKIAEEFADEDVEVSPTAEAVPEKEVAKVEKSAKHDEPSQPAKNLTAGKAPTESMAKKARAETRLPSSLPKDVAQYSVGKFTVQVAAFAQEDEAKKRAEELKHQGYSAFYVPANVKGKTWYRVSVGLFATEKEAKAYRSEFSGKAKGGNSAIVQKITN